MEWHRRNGVVGLPRALWCLGIIVIAALVGACSEDKGSPEAQVRAFFERAEAAIDQRELGDLKEMIAEDYLDSAGRDKTAVVNILRLHFLRNQAVYMLLKIHTISFSSEERARVDVAVAMAGTPIADKLAAIRGNLKRFDLELTRVDGSDWLLRQADWRDAQVDDFL